MYKVVITVTGRCMEKFRPQRVKLEACIYRAPKTWIHGFETKKLGVGDEQKKKIICLHSVMKNLDAEK